ncbi:helix-turn-helix domain-containing protein [Peribacillus simplex]|uniref:Helix-turn-helix domain-containing protein n=2 Tax=Peribacillus TaxID=2675229 RepID=A0AA90P559_9BACI|nr:MULTISPECIES: helix-turn-helix domain-containing protein [Peribacillus]MDP1420122.1 helix-turn-helix domain-containing protein [Peribacillus simplex]MDP1453788.1 helix-turn-helix domain-containing protein [Peribacillus frigoritolerans]
MQNTSSEYLTKSELARVLIVSHSTVIRWISEGKVPSIVEINNQSLIPKETIPLIKRNVGFINTDEYMRLDEFLRFFNISRETYLNWIKRGWVKDTVRYGGNTTYIPLSSIDEIKKLCGYVNEEDYINTKQLSSILDVSQSKILRFIKSGLIVNGHLYKDKYLFKLDSINEIKQSIGYYDGFNPNEYLRINQAKEKLNLDFDFHYWKSKIPYILHMGNPYIHTKDLNLIFDLIKGKKPKAPSSIPGLEHYVDTRTAAELLQIGQATVSVLINTEKIKGAIKVPINSSQTKWMIPVESIDDYKQRRISMIEDKTAVLIPTDTLSLKMIAEKTGVPYDSLRLKVRNKQLFPNAQKIKGIYCIPIEEANHFIENTRQHRYEKKGDIYTNKDALEELLHYITVFPLPFHLGKTAELFTGFCKIKLSKLRGNPRHIRTFFNYYKFMFETLRYLDKNLHELDVSVIDGIVYEQMTNEHTKRIFISFYYYCYSSRDLPVPKQYVVSKLIKDKKKEKEIYSPEAFYSFYRYVKDASLHLPNAISNEYYANMWAFTIMHLTNAWRASDIVFKTPNIDIFSIQVDSFDWFNNNILSITQCQKVINQLYLHFRSIQTSKTTAFVTFLVEPELVEALSTALIISELHRQKNKNSFLLESFITGTKIKTVATSGKNRHQHFFKLDSTLEPFKSLKFNNSTMTYLFYSISDEDGNDSDVALELTQRVRSHNSAETTAIYVQATNKDGSLNQVSANLFRRGHFGWLYNYLILLASEKDDAPRTMEDKTLAISALRDQLGSPVNTELWAQFLLQIKQKQSSVMSRLAKLSKESLIELLVKIFKGEMPSKTENAQCITSPNCEYPRLNSCYSCPNVIPKNYLFIELRGEFDRLINSIETTAHDAIRKKESYFLLNLLLLLDEGINFFGEEYIEAFLNIQHVRKKLSQLADKIYIE